MAGRWTWLHSMAPSLKKPHRWIDARIESLDPDVEWVECTG